MDWHGDEFQNLVSRAQRGDERAKESVVLATEAVVYKHARDGDERQEAFISVLIALDRYNPELGPWGPYVTTAVLRGLFWYRIKETRWRHKNRELHQDVNTVQAKDRGLHLARRVWAREKGPTKR